MLMPPLYGRALTTVGGSDGTDREHLIFVPFPERKVLVDLPGMPSGQSALCFTVFVVGAKIRAGSAVHSSAHDRPPRRAAALPGHDQCVRRRQARWGKAPQP